MTEPSDPDTGDFGLPESGAYGLPGSGYGLPEPGEEDDPTPPSGFASGQYAVSPLLPPVPLPPPPAPPSPVPPQPAAGQPQPPLGSPRTERESVVTLFLAYMFPIGHLPVATDRPALQLPLPPGGHGPYDHPDSELLSVGDAAALAHILARFRRKPTELPQLVPSKLIEDYYPFGHASEAVWARRFVVGTGPYGLEYLWPPEEQYPEGSIDPPVPVILEEGTLLDRFGPVFGRVFAVDETPFEDRSLPPGMLSQEYRRYWVVRPVPMWRSESAQWFGQPGGGTRYRAVLGAEELVTLGFLAEFAGEDG